MKIKTAFIIITCCLIGCISYIYFWHKPVIINKPFVYNKFLSDSLFNPIDSIDFKEGNNRIIVYTNWRDIQFLPENIKKSTLLECRDNGIIEQVQTNFVFLRISKDFLETTNYDSRIFFIKNNQLVFSSEFIIDNSISMHFKNTAWTRAVKYDELISCFSKFERIYFPFIKLEQ